MAFQAASIRRQRDAESGFKAGRCWRGWRPSHVRSTQEKEGAVNLLEAFIPHVQAYVKAGILSAANGQTLIEAAQNAINQLGA